MARPELSPAETSDPRQEDLPRILQAPIDIRSISITGIFLLGLLYSLYFARDFLLPVVLAFILSLLLAPVVRWLNRMRIPQAISAAVIITGLVGLSAYGVYRLATPAQQWLQKAP